VRRLTRQRTEGSDRSQLALVGTLPGAAARTAIITHSTRNKSLLLSGPSDLLLVHATSGDERWRGPLADPAVSVALGPKHDRIAVVDGGGRLRTWSVDDPHPEAGLAAFFAPVWYEGADDPGYSWQSSGGSDGVEPKISLVPLLWGTLKATFYALLCAIPIALLAATYVAEFLSPRARSMIKPAIEVMASMPSVVLGFLAAYWLAPRLADHIPAIVAVLVVLPLGSMAVGWTWTRLPMTWRTLIPPGREWLAMVPVAGLWAWIGWSLGGWLDPVLFPAADGGGFRAWWMGATGAAAEQRNALVVGFAMGFAVVPIIFTIAEDALGNVPKALRSGALALGASRWQTVAGVVIPSAAPGIFSALMVGLGRAIGETMIVVMATGSTPIMTFDPFSGMRTISATIAIELPEAPVDGTLYRTLFLAALLLFLMTFLINTAAEVLRQRLRSTYQG
jgi:phosphate transport system permease protein